MHIEDGKIGFMLVLPFLLCSFNKCVQLQPVSLCMFVIKPSSHALSKCAKVKGFKTFLKMLILSSYKFFLSAIVSPISVLWVCGHAAVPGSSQQSGDTACPMHSHVARPPVMGSKVEAFHYPRI